MLNVHSGRARASKCRLPKIAKIYNATMSALFPLILMSGIVSAPSVDNNRFGILKYRNVDVIMTGWERGYGID